MSEQSTVYSSTDLTAVCMFKSLCVFVSKVKSFEKDRPFEKRIPESDLADHIIQKCRNKFFEERSTR